jgi:chemotaxis protein MotB
MLRPRKSGREGHLVLRSTWLHRSALVLVITSMALAGCVTRGRYNELLAENENLRARTAQLSRQSAGLADVAAGLSMELRLRDHELAQLEREQRELAEELDAWLVAGTIKMLLLADGLHVLLSEEVLFTSGSADLKPSGQQILKQVVLELEQVPYEIAVLGYTDNVPIGGQLAQRFPSNWELAGARAASVVRLFHGEGIPAEQLLAVSFGESHPIASNDTPEGRAENRRIEVRLRPVIRQPGT